MIVHVIQLNASDVYNDRLYLGPSPDNVLNKVIEDIAPRVEESEEADALKCVESIDGLKEWFSEHFCFYTVEYFTRDVK